MVLHYIGVVGQFTGLSLNLKKTIAYSHWNKSYTLAGIRISNTPVKYLGAIVSAKDLSTANFKHLLQKARKITTKWSSRHLTIPAQVLVVKTFVFSTFIHICNCVYLITDQLQLLQSILNQFIWQGRNKICPTVMYAPVDQRGLNMINVKNVVHVLWVKWMDRLCKDAGSSWPRFAWEHLTNILAPRMIVGLTGIDENTLESLPKFYRAVVHSYCHAMSLFYAKN